MKDLADRLFCLISVLLTTFYVKGETTLLCYCTEPDCLAQGTNMCIQENADFGCYKQFYNRHDPPITMGCVNSNLLCDHLLRPIGIPLQDWPYTTCCTESYCNKDLPIPAVYTGNSSQSSTTPRLFVTSKPSTQFIQIAISNMAIETDSEAAAEDDQSDSVHPVFLLLIVLVIIFTIVVVISLLVIIKIWLYRRKKLAASHTHTYGNGRVVLSADRQSSALLPERTWTGWNPNQSKSLLPASAGIWEHKQDRVYYDTSESTLNESV